MAEKTERIYVVPLRRAYNYVRKKRARKAVKLLRAFLARHMKTDLDNVFLSEAVNSLLWKRSISTPPRKVKVRAIKEGEKVTAYLMSETPGAKAEEKKVKKPAEKKEEKPPAKEEPPKEEKPKPAEKEAEEKPKGAPEEETAKEEKKG
jgi:large subunit ribosomal protein L31e